MDLKNSEVKYCVLACSQAPQPGYDRRARERKKEAETKKTRKEKREKNENSWWPSEGALGGVREKVD